MLFGKPMQLGLPTVKLDFLEDSESLIESPKSRYLRWESNCGAQAAQSLAITSRQCSCC